MWCKLSPLQRIFSRGKAMPRLPRAGGGNQPEKLPELCEKAMWL